MKNDRFLTAILVGIAVIAVLAVALYVVRRGQVDYVAEDQPAGVVQNYILAIYQQDFERAYGYLADGEYKPSQDEFEAWVFSQKSQLSTVSPQVIEGSVTGDKAQVNVLLQHRGGFLDGGYREDGQALLVRAGDEWKITQMPYPFWGWDWYPQAVPPGKEIP